jgi:hypothetical protein
LYRSDHGNGVVPDSLSGDGFEDMCNMTSTVDLGSDATPPISSDMERMIEDLQNPSSSPKSNVSGKLPYTHSEPQLPAMATRTQQQQDAPAIEMSKSELFDLKVKTDMEGVTNFSDGRLIQATKSLPVWMPSVAVSTKLSEEKEEQLSFREEGTPMTQKAESAHRSENSLSAGLSLSLLNYCTVHQLGLNI